jgi:hypothetical protein
MKTDLQDPVQYHLPIGEDSIPLNEYLGSKITLKYTDKIQCISCGVFTKKSFGQGHCYACFQKLASCDMCIMKPETCHFHLGTCREPEWAQSHCFIDHTIYLANSSGVKVGITRSNQRQTRWMDQGAISAIPLATVTDRFKSGQAEVFFKQFVSDKTNWRKMLKNEVEDIDLEEIREEMQEEWPQEIAATTDTSTSQLNISYPVLEYPTKITSLNFDKNPLVEGTLLGIKGQYLLLDTGVINIRKFQGYQVEISLSK